MTSLEILEKIFAKVDENELEIHFYKDGYLYQAVLEGIAPIESLYGVIFNPVFAKALWGEKLIDKDSKIKIKFNNDSSLMKWAKNEFKEMYNIQYLWQYHQHKMLDEIQAGRDPIKYLEQFID